MTRTRPLRIVVCVFIVLVVAIGGLGWIVAVRLAGFEPIRYRSTEQTKECPGQRPSDCRNLAAEALAVPAAELPILNVIPGLTYKSGGVALPPGPRQVVFTYARTDVPHLSFQVVIRALAPSTTESYPNIATTPHGRRYRRSVPADSSFVFAFEDQHFSYSVAGFETRLDDAIVLPIAERLIDAIHPTTPQTGP